MFSGINRGFGGSRPWAVAGIEQAVFRHIRFAVGLSCIRCNHLPDGVHRFPVFLFPQGPVKAGPEIVGADAFQYLILGLLGVQFVQQSKVSQRGAALDTLFEFLAVKGEQLHAAANRGFGKARLVGDLLHAVAEVHHHLEALGLLIDGQIAALHILGHHGRDLLFGGHIINHDAGQFGQPGSLSSGQTAVPDNDGVAIRVAELVQLRAVFLGGVGVILPAQFLVIHIGVCTGHNGQILQNAVCLDAGGQLGNVAQIFAGVVRVGVQLRDRNHCDIGIHSGILLCLLDWLSSLLKLSKN